MALVLENDEVINFQLVFNGVLGPARRLSRVEGVVSYRAAIEKDPEINVKHNALYPYFKNAVNNVNDPSAYKYVILSNSAGQSEVLGLPWILESSVQRVSNSRATLVITPFSESLRASLSRFLTEAGAQFTINVEDE